MRLGRLIVVAIRITEGLIKLSHLWNHAICLPGLVLGTKQGRHIERVPLDWGAAINLLYVGKFNRIGLFLALDLFDGGLQSILVVRFPPDRMFLYALGQMRQMKVVVKHILRTVLTWTVLRLEEGETGIGKRVGIQTLPDVGETIFERHGILYFIYIASI